MKKILFLTIAILASITFMLYKMKNLINFIKHTDPAITSTAEVFLYQGLWARFLHYPASFLYKCNLFFLARLTSQVARFFTGIEIHPGATLSNTVFIDHGGGVVIGETAQVGKNVVIYQGVTLGGTGKERGPKRHPNVCDNVMIGAGSILLGPITIGDNAKIGASSVVLEDVTPGDTVVGLKGRPTSYWRNQS